MTARLRAPRCPARRRADDLGRAAQDPPAARARRQGHGHRSLRMGGVHLGQRRAGDPGEVRRVRPRRPLLRRAQGRCCRRGHGPRAARLGHHPRPRAHRRTVGAQVCSRRGPRSTRTSTRSTGSSCRAPTSPPRPSSPASRTWAGWSTTSPPTARCGRPHRPRRCATRSRTARSTRSSSPRARRSATSSASPASRTRHRRGLHRARDRQDGGGARAAGRRPRAGGRRRRPSSTRSPTTAAHSPWPRRRRGRRPAPQPATARRPPSGHVSVAGFPTSRPRRLRATPAVCAARRADASAPAQTRAAGVRPRGHSTTPCRSRRCRASSSTRWSRWWSGRALRGRRARRDHGLRRPRRQGRHRVWRATTRTASSTWPCVASPTRSARSSS